MIFSPYFKLSRRLRAVLLAGVAALCTGVVSKYPFPAGQDRQLPQTAAELGKRLFFDPILSGNRQVSCASCHKPDFAFADNQPVSLGIDGMPTVRNTPSITYMSGRVRYFWDGRAQSLEEQAVGPITHPNEMNLPLDEAVQRLNADPFYAEAFNRIYYSPPNVDYLCKALADFQRSLEPYNSPYDEFLRGNLDAMSDAAIRGLDVYLTGNCKDCHGMGQDFSSDELTSIGVVRQGTSDLGLFSITRDSSDIGKFKTPHLRNVARTAPYMHDGSVKTLREVIDFYNTPDQFSAGLNVDQRMKGRRKMTEQEVDDLIAFLHALSDK